MLGCGWPQSFRRRLKKAEEHRTTFAQLKRVSILQLGLLDPLSVQEKPVEALEVPCPPTPSFREDLGMETANQGCGYLHIAARVPADAKRLIKPNVQAGGFAGLDPKSDGVRRSLSISRVHPCGEGARSARLPP